MERTADLFCKLRNELTTEDLKRNASFLQRSAVITTLVPYTLASLEGLSDCKVCVFFFTFKNVVICDIASNVWANQRSQYRKHITTHV